MKKLLLITSFLIVFAPAVLDNPIYIPAVTISELTFNQKGNWLIELTFDSYLGGYTHDRFDSICVFSTVGISSIRTKFIRDSTNILVINSDSLNSPLAIDKNGDCIGLHIYSAAGQNIYVHDDSLKFGNYPGSLIDSIPSGCSLCRYGYDGICKCMKPTLGFLNDTAGTYFTMKGHIYRKNGSPIISGDLRFDNSLVINNDGSYSTNIFSRNLHLTAINGDLEVEKYNIQPFNVNVNPGTVVEHDIYLLVDLMNVDNNPQPNDPNITVINYPNPFNLSTNFYVKIPSGLRQKKGSIVIYDLKGRTVKTLPLSNGSLVKWNAEDINGRTVSSGVYYYSLMFDNINYKSGSLILLK